MVPLQDNLTKRRTFAISKAFTLVELLVVIAIIAMLVAMLLPAVQSAREAGRRAQCMNNLRNMALACLNHHETHNFLPSGGWGRHWVCDPDRGFGERQPGGWAYHVLPFLESGDLHNLGAGASDAEKRRFNKQRITTPQAIFHCPSRREARLYPVDSFSWNRQPNFTDPLTEVARTDYAANGGDTVSGLFGNGWSDGPNSFEQGDSGRYNWPSLARHNGITANRSEIGMEKIIDGTSKTYLVGEKYLNPASYAAGDDWGDNHNLFSGDDMEIVRFAGGVAQLSRDQQGLVLYFAFGSAHPNGCHMSMCDGSVRQVAYALDSEVHRQFASRNDGAVISGL